MEFCDAFIAIHRNSKNPVDAAIAVINAQLPTNDLNLELTRLLLDSSGFRAQIPKNLVMKLDFKKILGWIKKNTPAVRTSEIPLRNTKYFQRCALFFEQVFYLDWNKFANEGNFDTYFGELLHRLSVWNSEPLNEISFALELKLVTAFLRRANDGIEQDQSCKPKVISYATEVHQNTIFYKTANCQLFGNAELYEWIKLDNSFATDENLRSVVWSTKLDKPSVVCHALSIAYSLLRIEHLQEKLMLFVPKLVTIFEDLCFTENCLIFDWICRCCEFIYKHHRENISSEFMGNLLDNLYAENRRRAKSAAGFWISSIFDPNCHRTNIRMILKFLEGRGFDHWKIIVDSLIDDYSVIVNWELLAKILLDEDDDVSEETKLTAEDKGGLVTLMAYAIEETVTGFPPEYRMTDMKQLDMSTCLKFSNKVTEMLVPRFWKLFCIEYPHKERIQIMLMYIIKFFNFVIVDEENLKQFVKLSVSLFENCCLPYSFQVVMEVLKLIMSHVQNEEVVELCNTSYLTLRNDYESKLVELINDFFNNPNKYADLDSDCAKRANGILTRVLCINRIVNFSRVVAFSLPQQLLARNIPSYNLARNIPPYNPVLLSILHVCVHLLSEHIYRAAIDLMEYLNKEQTLPENHPGIMKDVDFACKQLIIKLIEWYQWTDLAVATFLSLCKIFDAIKNWPLTEDMKNSLIPKDAQILIARFVESMVWKVDDKLSRIVDNGTKTYILEGFLNMIEWKLLPLKLAYDPITYLKQTDTTYTYMEKPLQRFISEICDLEEEASVVDWLATWLTGMFRLFPENCMNIVSDFVDLIYPICKKIQNILYLVALKGIDFALSKTNRKGKSTPESNLRFLPVLAKFCECLNESKKNSIEAFFKQNTFPNDGVKTLRSFIKCLKKKTAPRKQEQSKPIAISSPILSSQRSSVAAFEDNLAIWSPSTIFGSNSALTDGSDLEFRCSSVIPWIKFSNRDEQNSALFNDPRDVMNCDDNYEEIPFAFSNPDEKSSSQTKITGDSKAESPSKSTSSDKSVNILLGTSFKTRQITLLDGYTAARRDPSSSTLIEGTVNMYKNPSTPSTSVMYRSSEDGADAVFSTRSEKLGIQAKNTPQVLDNVTDLLNIQSPIVVDDTVAKSASVTESSGDFPVDDILNNISMFSSPKESNDQIKNTSQTYGSVSELLKDLEPSVLDEFAVGKSPSVSKSSGRISDVVENLQRASLSNSEIESSRSSSEFDKSPIKKKRRSRF